MELSEIEKQNGMAVYEYVKQQFESSAGTFFKDYFGDGVSPNVFLEDLKKYEPWLDLKNHVSESDLEKVWDNITEGIANSNFIMGMVDGITDKYYGDESY